MANIIITTATEAETMANEIIDTEDEFERLRVETVVYVFRDKAQKKQGRTTYGTAEVVRGKNAHLYWSAQGKEDAPPFYRITLAEDIWQTLDEDQQKWLLRHELRHCGLKVTPQGLRLTTVPHDFELFFADMKDPVFSEVCAVIKAVQQLQTKMEI